MEDIFSHTGTFITEENYYLSFLEWKVKIHYVRVICHCCSFKSAMNIFFMNTIFVWPGLIDANYCKFKYLIQSKYLQEKDCTQNNRFYI